MSLGNLPAGSLNRLSTRGAVTTQQATFRFGGGGLEGFVRHHATWTGDLLLPQMAAAVRRALQQTIKLAIKIARRLVPVDTGRLYESIRSGGVIESGDALIGRVVAGGVVRRGIMVDYAIWQEIGTRFNRAHHYMLRAGQEAAGFFYAFLLVKHGGFGAQQPGGVEL